MMEEEQKEVESGPLMFCGIEFAMRSEKLPKTILEFRSNDEVYYMGKRIESDKEIIKILKEFIRYSGWNF